jgi:peptidoglycan-associated lipoprotein
MKKSFLFKSFLIVFLLSFLFGCIGKRINPNAGIPKIEVPTETVIAPLEPVAVPSVVVPTETVKISKPVVVEKENIDVQDKDSANQAYLNPVSVAEPDIKQVKIDKKIDMKVIYFDFNKSEIKDEYKDFLNENIKWLKANPDYNVLIEGHTDRRGSVKYNLGLGQERASKVRTYLSYFGINPTRLATISYGGEKPLSKIDNEEGWAKNRRAELKVYKR